MNTENISQPEGWAAVRCSAIVRRLGKSLDVMAGWLDLLTLARDDGGGKPCCCCDGKGYRREQRYGSKQNRYGREARKESTDAANKSNSRRIQLLILWGQACEPAISKRGWNADGEQRQDNTSSANIGSLGGYQQSGGHLKTSVCPHELSEIILFFGVGHVECGANPPNI